MNTKNVLHLRSCRGGGGGPEKTILFSALETDTSSFSTHIAYLRSRHDEEFDLHRRASKLGIENFYTIEEDFKFDLQALRQLLRLLRAKNIHVLHCHCYKSDLYGLILARFHPMKLVTTVHGPLASLRFFWASQNWRVRYLYDQLDLRLLRYFDHVMMVSDSMRQTVMRYGVSARQLTWVKNSIDSAFFKRSSPPRISDRTRYGVPEEAIVVGAVGRLNGEKDYPTFLQTARILVNKRDNVYFTIAGKGELEPAIRKQIAELGLEKRVLLLGHFHDVRPVYEMLDVYALSSTREGLPNTVLEAMAMEVPIAATDVDGVKEAAAHEAEALLVPPREPTRLAQAIETLITTPAVAHRLRRAARTKIERDFTFASRVRDEERIYRYVLSH